MKAKEFLDEIESPVDWLNGLMPCFMPFDTDVFQESEMGEFLNRLVKSPDHQQEALVVGSDITRRNLLYKTVADAVTGLIKIRNSEQIILSNGTQIHFTYCFRLQGKPATGFNFDIVLLGDPIDAPEVV